jgi:hypothetical protein
VKAWSIVATLPSYELRGFPDFRAFDILHNLLYDKFMTFVWELMFKILCCVGEPETLYKLRAPAVV